MCLRASTQGLALVFAEYRMTDDACTSLHKSPLEQSLDSLLVATASGRLSELMMTKPKPSLSFRLMMTSLGCVLGVDVLSEGALVLPMLALGAWVVVLLLPYVKSLRGELCCVETEPGLRPFSGQDSPVGGSTELSRHVHKERSIYKSIFTALILSYF